MERKEIHQRQEEDGHFKEQAGHFEMYETKVYYKPENHRCIIMIPMDLVRHLSLNNKDRVVVAIKKIEEERRIFWVGTRSYELTKEELAQEVEPEDLEEVWASMEPAEEEG